MLLHVTKAGVCIFVLYQLPNCLDEYLMLYYLESVKNKEWLFLSFSLWSWFGWSIWVPILKKNASQI
ncbi:hypothetical protein NRI_0309 [Neorickettsia risticii str. Illinois]|uniref:Uncharacterized protein n=1 Tax=Neorickettsia risticii (strain Illinois) TaxID=434131 RepID=C6V4I0_NEORI|nr:hypothetical protein NRI_0309 [Neorickettsia risticii str. Illinois]